MCIYIFMILFVLMIGGILFCLIWFVRANGGAFYNICLCRILTSVYSFKCVLFFKTHSNIFQSSYMIYQFKINKKYFPKIFHEVIVKLSIIVSFKLYCLPNNLFSKNIIYIKKSYRQTANCLFIIFLISKTIITLLV